MRWIDKDSLRRNLLGLDEVRFAELCNAVLSDVAARNRVGRECLSLNLKTKEPDGGIDARCSGSTATAGLLIPRANVDYQYKSGRGEKSIPQIVEEDILKKPRVLDGLRDGHAFVYLAAWDRGDAISDDLVKKLREKGVQVESGQVMFVGGETLSDLLERTPALLSRFFGVGDTTVSSFEHWAAFPPLTNPFQTDAGVDAQLRELRLRIEAPASTVRIVGAAGDGKTRLVLEALRGSELRDNVLYASQVDYVSVSLKAFLRHTGDVHCTLVVDEVDDAEAARLENELAPRPEGVRLVLIGLDASGRAPAETLQVEGLDDSLLAGVIRSIATGLDEERARATARDCERSPKLAVLIASRIKDNPTLAIPQLLADGPVRNALDRYLSVAPGDAKWDAIATCALLIRVGWSGEFEEESTRLFQAVGLPVVNARRHVQDLHDRFGIAPEAGRFRYVSPAILGDHLAVRHLEAWTRADLMRVFQGFTPSMADSFSRRARRLSAVLVNRATVEEVILGDQSPFRDLTDLEGGGMSRVVQRLAAPFPVATLRTLEHALGSARSEELKAAVRSRRDIVWALEQLLWPENTFERAARLLLKLGAAENETWGNNATGIWAETFQTTLGRTAAGWRSRTRVVREAANSNDPAERRLAVAAIRSAFRTGYITRGGNPPADVAGMPDKEWRPKTYGEWWDSMIAFLDILEPLLRDPVPEVSIFAAEAMGEIAGELFHLGERVSDRWSEIARSLERASYDLRGPLLKAIEAITDRWEYRLSNPLDDEQPADERNREWIRKLIARVSDVRTVLAGSDFQSRFRTAVGRPLHRIGRSAGFDGEDATARVEMRKLASEAIEAPGLLGDEWSYLLSEEGWWQSERWCEVLGEVDYPRVFADQLQSLSQNAPRAIGWLSLYEIGQARAGRGNAHIDERAKELADLGLGNHALDLLLRSGFAPERVDTLQRIFSERLVSAAEVNRLAYSDWIQKLTPDQALSLLTTVLAHAEFAQDVNSFVAAYLQSHPDADPVLRTQAVRILTSPPRPEEDYRRSSSTHEWETLAKRYVDEMPYEIGAAALDKVAAHGHADNAGLIEVLQRAWTAADKRRFFEQVVSPRLLGQGVPAWHMREAIAQTAIAEVGEEPLLRWVSADPKRRAPLLADVLGAPHGRMSDLHAALLERYGEYGVASVYRSNFSSGSWWGDLSDWMKSKIADAEQLASDERPVVREWATSLLQGLRQELTWAEAREAEERLDRS